MIYWISLPKYGDEFVQDSHLFPFSPEGFSFRHRLLYFIVIAYLSGACIHGQSALPLEDSDEVFVVLCALEDLLFVYATEDGVIDSCVGCFSCGSWHGGYLYYIGVCLHEHCLGYGHLGEGEEAFAKFVE